MQAFSERGFVTPFGSRKVSEDRVPQKNTPGQGSGKAYRVSLRLSECMPADEIADRTPRNRDSMVDPLFDWDALDRAETRNRTRSLPARLRRRNKSSKYSARDPSQAACENAAADLRARANAAAKLRSLLRSARPAWRETTLQSAVLKLAVVGVTSVPLLERALAGNLNSQLRAAGLKAFTADTLKDLRARACTLLPGQATTDSDCENGSSYDCTEENTEQALASSDETDEEDEDTLHVPHGTSEALERSRHESEIQEPVSVADDFRDWVNQRPPMHRLSVHSSGPAAANPVQNGISWDFPLAKCEKRELLLLHMAAGERMAAAKAAEAEREVQVCRLEEQRRLSGMSQRSSRGSGNQRRSGPS